MNQRTRTMSIHKALQSEWWQRPYISRKEGGRGFAIIEDSIDASIQRHEHEDGTKK